MLRTSGSIDIKKHSVKVWEQRRLGAADGSQDLLVGHFSNYYTACHTVTHRKSSQPMYVSIDERAIDIKQVNWDWNHRPAPVLITSELENK